MSPDRNREVSVLVLVDASEGDFYSRGTHGATPFLALDQTTADGVPFAGRKGQGYPDPRSWRLHDLGTTLGGQDDLRVSVQVVNDYEGEYASPGSPGEAPLGQPEWFTGRNRSTREADLAGRVALPGSQRKIVDSEDGRYALALTLGDTGAAPVVPVAAQVQAEGELPPGIKFNAAGTERTAGGFGSVARSVESVTFSSGPTGGAGLTFFGADAVRAARDALAAGGSVQDAARWASAAANGRARPPLQDAGQTRTRTPAPAAPPPPARAARNKPAGYVVNDAGRVGQLGTVLDPSLQPKHWHVGREGSRIGIAPVRHDAQVGMRVGGEILVGRVAFEAEDASSYGRGRGRPIKGRMAFDRTRANKDSALGDEVGQWVPVLELDPSDVEGRDPTRIALPGGIKGKGKEKDKDEEKDEEETGPGPVRTIPWWVEVPVKGSDPIVVPDGTEQTFDGIGSIQDGQVQLFGDGLQQRDLTGPGTPCPNSVGAIPSEGDPWADQVAGITAEGVAILGGSAGATSLGGALGNALKGQLVAPGHVAVSTGPDGQVLLGGGTEALAIDTVPGGEPIALGQQSVLSAPVPFWGQAGGPRTLEGWSQWITSTVRGLQRVVQGAFGGPGYLAANMALVHKNTQGNPPSPSVIAHDYAALPGQQLVVTAPALEVSSTLRAEQGSTIDAPAGAGCARFVRAVQGSVRDDRAALAVEGGGAGGDLLAMHNAAPGQVTAGRDFHVDAEAVVGCSGVRALLKAGQPQPEFPIAVGYQDPATGDQLGDTLIGLRSDGTQAIKDLSDSPDPPRDGSVLVYAKNGTAYQMTSDGTETALGSSSGVTIQEEDGTPAGTLSTLKFPNGSLTDNGGGSFSISLSGGLSNPVTIAQGGTGQATASDARTALGLAIGSDVQAYDSLLSEFAALVPSAGQFVGFDGGGNLAVVSGSGGISGSGTDNRLVRWDGTSAVQSSGWSLSDADAMSGVSMSLTTPLPSTSGGLGLNGVADSKTVYSNASNTYTTGTMADAFGEIHPPGSGAWVAQAGTWTSLGTTPRNFLGSPAAGTMGFQGFADFTRSAGGGSGTELAQFEQTSTAATSMVPLVLDAHPSGGNHSAAAGLSISAQRGGATVGTHQLVNAYGTNAYDYGLMQTASTTKFMALDTSENCARMNNSSGLNIVHESGSTKPTVAAGESRFYAFGSDGVPLVRSKVGTTTTDYRMWPEGAVADVGDPTGYTDIITQIVPWMVSLRDNFRASAFMA